MNGIDFPNISPIIFSVGPLAIRWYSMAYLVGILLAWFLLNRNIKKYDLPLNKEKLEDLVFFSTLGIVLGGRVGYVLFYGGDAFWHNPLLILQVWKGGMSFHGGVLGVIVAMIFFARKYQLPFLQVSDWVVLYAPIGLFCGRLANFVNDELWGRVTTVPWAVRFPSGGYLPRHPSQLYEAFFEGIVMFLVLNVLWRSKKIRETFGVISATFISCYGLFRILMEQFREPDVQLGFLWNFITMGQLLSLPLVLGGAVVLFMVLRRRHV